jgi:hypothetical protein
MSRTFTRPKLFGGGGLDVVAHIGFVRALAFVPRFRFKEGPVASTIGWVLTSTRKMAMRKGSSARSGAIASTTLSSLACVIVGPFCAHNRITTTRRELTFPCARMRRSRAQSEPTAISWPLPFLGGLHHRYQRLSVSDRDSPLTVGRKPDGQMRQFYKRKSLKPP